MKKIVSTLLTMLIVFSTMFTTVGCSSKNKEVYVYRKELDFFNVSVSYKEDESPSSSADSYLWVVEVSPKTDDYFFGATSDMEVEIYYTYHTDDGDLIYVSKIIEVDYDSNGYGYSEMSFNLKYCESLILLGFDAKVFEYEKATKKLKKHRIDINQNNILEHCKVSCTMQSQNIGLKPLVSIYIDDLLERSIVMTVEFEVSFKCNYYFEPNTVKFQSTFSYAKGNNHDFKSNRPIKGDIIYYYDLDGCHHSIDPDTVKLLNYKVISASGYIILDKD